MLESLKSTEVDKMKWEAASFFLPSLNINSVGVWHFCRPQIVLRAPYFWCLDTSHQLLYPWVASRELCQYQSSPTAVYESCWTLLTTQGDPYHPLCLSACQKHCPTDSSHSPDQPVLHVHPSEALSLCLTPSIWLWLCSCLFVLCEYFSRYQKTKIDSNLALVVPNL